MTILGSDVRLMPSLHRQSVLQSSNSQAFMLGSPSPPTQLLSPLVKQSGYRRCHLIPKSNTRSSTSHLASNLASFANTPCCFYNPDSSVLSRVCSDPVIYAPFLAHTAIYSCKIFTLSLVCFPYSFALSVPCNTSSSTNFL